MFFIMVFCTFTLTRCIPGTTGDCGVCVPQPIENVYPECFRGGEKTGIAVRQEDFKPTRGYAVCPFDAPDENRNHFERRKPNENVLFVVIHFTGEHVDFATTVRLFTSNITRGKVSSHYVIAKPAEAVTDRQLLQVVPENYVAYHAGNSSWGDRWSINRQSIGIEIVNDGLLADRSWDPFHREQIRIVGSTVARMADQYRVSPRRVVGHADVAPHRKIDPGVMFPWAVLYNVYGVGAWLDDDETDETVVAARYKPAMPCPRAVNRTLFVRYLRAYGYDVNDEVAAIMAFKAHFTANQRPRSYNPNITRVDMYWIWALVVKYSSLDSWTPY